MPSLGKFLSAHFGAEDVKAIEGWRRRQEQIPPVAETLRQLVRLGIEHAQLHDRERAA
jgi:hypothetical protein